MEKLKTFIKESVDEMRNKVSWPKYAELQNSSVLVLVASIVFAVVIGMVDVLFKETMDWFYSAF